MNNFQTFSNEAVKPSRMQDHLHRKHLDKKDAPLSYFKSLLDKSHGRNSLNITFEKSKLKVDDGLIASCNISKLIAQTLEPHTIGEVLIVPNLKEVISIVMHENRIKHSTWKRKLSLWKILLL